MASPLEKAWDQFLAIPVSELNQEKVDQLFDQAAREEFLEELGVAQAEGRDLMAETRQRLFLPEKKPTQ